MFLRPCQGGFKGKPGRPHKQKLIPGNFPRNFREVSLEIWGEKSLSWLLGTSYYFGGELRKKKTIFNGKLFFFTWILCLGGPFKDGKAIKNP